MLINVFKNNMSVQYNGVHLNQLYNTDIELQLKLFTLLNAHDTIVLAETERELQSALDAVQYYNVRIIMNVHYVVRYNGKLFRVIYNMYDAAKSCIKVGNNLSEVFHCNI